MMSGETDDNRQTDGTGARAAAPLAPIRGHPSGRGSQALKTASLRREGAGLAPRLGHLGGEGGLPAGQFTPGEEEEG